MIAIPARLWMRLADAPVSEGSFATLSARRHRDGRLAAVALDVDPGHPGAFAVDAVVLRAGWGPVAVVSLLYRRTDLEHEDFSMHWRSAHARFGLGLAAARAYIQFHALPGSPLDGVAVLAFDSEEAARAALAVPLITVEARDDEERFLDRERCVSFLCDATLGRPASPPA